MKIYTGNFANVKKYVAAGYLPISIAISAKYFNGLKYPKLNPRKDFMNDSPDSYIPKFNEILKTLNANEVVKELHRISEGSDVVLLCHEKAGDFCHRRLVAEWLLNEKGIEVPELGKMEMQKSLF